MFAPSIRIDHSISANSGTFAEDGLRRGGSAAKLGGERAIRTAVTTITSGSSVGMNLGRRRFIERSP